MKPKTKMSIRSLMFLFMALSLTLTGFAKGPDFSGKWKLNEAESKRNTEFSFAPIRLDIVQEANKLTSERTSQWQGEEYSSTSTYTLDGKESMNEGFQGSQVASVATWSEDGKSLNIATTIEMGNGGELDILANYKIDGKKLIIENKVTGGPNGESNETWVYNKE